MNHALYNWRSNSTLVVDYKGEKSYTITVASLFLDDLTYICTGISCLKVRLRSRKLSHLSCYHIITSSMILAVADQALFDSLMTALLY